jgi:hypothetical protein
MSRRKPSPAERPIHLRELDNLKAWPLLHIRCSQAGLAFQAALRQFSVFNFQLLMTACFSLT